MHILVTSKSFVSEMSSPAMPYVGSRISLISKSEIRYEGILYVINTEESTIALQNVRSYGTEGRITPDVPPTDEVYDFIIFRGEDIKDLTVLEGSATKPSQRAVLADPAVVSVGPERKIAQRPTSYAKESSNREQRGGAGNRDYQQTDRYARGGQNNRPAERKWEDRRPDNRNGQQTSSYHNQRSAPQEHRGGHNGGHQGGERRDGGYNTSRGYGKGGQRPPRQQNFTQRGGPIGELTANENPLTRAEVGTDEFDFSSANEKFEKPAELAKEGAQDTRAGYVKAKSFFDDISCDALDRAAAKDGGRPDRGSRDKQRELDKETFGASALNRPFGYGGHRRFQHGGKGGGKGRAY